MVSSSRIEAAAVQEIIGAPPPYRALFLAKSYVETGSPLLVICPDQETAEIAAENCSTLGRLILGQSIDVAVFPEWGHSLFSTISPSIRTRMARASLLGLMATGQNPKILFTSWPAASQATLPPSRLKEALISVRVGDSVESRERFVSRLIEAGYLQSDPVEDPGTYAVRGELVDLFPPHLKNPIRIELFGDSIEKMRFFDGQTQRTLNNETLNQVDIFPAREILIGPQNLSFLRSRIKDRSDELGVSRKFRDPLLSSLQDGVYPDHCDAWAPFAYEKRGTLFDYVDSRWRFAVFNRLAVEENWTQFENEQTDRENLLVKNQLIVPQPKELYPLDKESLIQCLNQAVITFDQVALGDSSSTLISNVSSHLDITPSPDKGFATLSARIEEWSKLGFKVLITASTQTQIERIRFLIKERGHVVSNDTSLKPGVVCVAEGALSEGFSATREGLIVLTETEVLGARQKSARKTSSRATSKSSASREWSGLQALSDLNPGDPVVHIEHGIGLYRGLSRLVHSGVPGDFILIEYADSNKLYVPVYRMNVIQKYMGDGSSAPLSRLGTPQFQKAKERAQESAKKLAIDLIQLYAERKVRPGVTFSGRDSEFREFEAAFPFEETPDQIRAIDEVLRDLESGRSMDRLICGDVGYGKTEVAIRAAFRAVSDGKQVAVLVPTTVLAHQHEQSFLNRLSQYPITVASVSRFKTPKERKSVLSAVSSGKVDIIIGTHRLLSKDVQFADLGLIVVDEEHRFGVEHKERLKTLKSNTHVLTLTATPIPRTLHLALSGLRDISLINTPPVDRMPIRTHLSRFDEGVIRQAITTELQRGGQVFFVNNRVQNIERIAQQISEWVPQSRVGVAHGQMVEGALEKAMIAFYQKQTNVLVCTSIIESGLDVPNANTIIINRADTFGLAQLYQIRGRVGRGQTRAHAYLLLPAEGILTGDAKRRLEVIQKFVELGSGFNIASHDLEIRGGGDILGAAQSGHIAAIGFDLFTELLDAAVRELEGKPLDPQDLRSEPEIKIPYPAFLPDAYVSDVHQRLSLYRRLSSARGEEPLLALEEELKDRFGALPLEAQNLLWLIRIKQLLKNWGVDQLTQGPEKITLTSTRESKLNPARAIAWVASDPKKYQLTPDSKLIIADKPSCMRDLYFELDSLLKRLT